MNNLRFEEIVEEFRKKEDELLSWKGKEYATYDRLGNFKEVGKFMGALPSEVCLFYLMKHIQSIANAIQKRSYTSKWYWEREGKEGLKQRIADARNYLLLLAACIEDEIKNGDSDS